MSAARTKIPGMPRSKRPVMETPAGVRLRCTRCGHSQPVLSFTVDRRAAYGRGYICRICREGTRKTRVIDPDWEVVHTKHIRLARHLKEPTTYAHGSWGRIVRHAQLLNENEVIAVTVEPDYISHHSARVALAKAARRIGCRVVILHGVKVIYVRPGMSKPGHGK